MAIKGRIKKECNNNLKKRNSTKKNFLHKDLVEKGKKWLKSQNGKYWYSPIVFSELVCIGIEIPDVIGFSSGSSTIIECKTSRSDFLKDKKKISRNVSYLGMGVYRFYMCPENLIKETELPDKWGLIYISENKRAKIIVKPKSQSCNYQAEKAYMYSVIRRLYSGDYDGIKKFFSKYCI